MSYSRNQGWIESFKDLSILTASGLILYTFSSATMLGLTDNIVKMLERNTWMPFTASLAALVLVFVASGTRDPSDYHPVETFVVLGSVVLMAAYSFLTPFANAVDTAGMWVSVPMLVMLIVASAILSR